MAFGALAMAIGLQYIVAYEILKIPGWQIAPLIPALSGIVALICFGLGLMWVVTSARILKGVKGVRREYRDHVGEIPDELLTCWIVRILAQYRENRQRFQWMITICRLGGCVFVTLGIVNLIQGFATPVFPAVGFAGIFPFIAAAINLTIGLCAIAISIEFHRYATIWDERIKTAAHSENALQCALERR